MTPEILDSLDHASLMSLRNQYAADDYIQELLAPYEHKAFAREYTKDNPIVGPAALAFSIPAYAGAKALKLHPSRTPTSMRQIVAGFEGIGQGLKDVWK